MDLGLILEQFLVKNHTEDRKYNWANGHWKDDTVRGWVAHPLWHWFTRCDRCGSRQVWLYDVWPDQEYTGFQWICSRCLIEVISFYVENSDNR